jgi:hypothetical protein
MSVISYLGERSAPMRSTFPLGSLGSMGTSLVPFVGSKAPACHLESGVPVASASLMTASSSEAIVAVASS